MEPAFDGAAVEVLAVGAGDAHDAATFEVGIDGVGDHIFLVVRTKIVIMNIVDDLSKQGGGEEIFADINHIRGGCSRSGLLSDTGEVAPVVEAKDAVAADCFPVNFDTENGRIFGVIDGGE